MSKRLLKIRHVEDKTTLDHSTIYRRVARGEFPAPVRVGVRGSAWIEAEIDEWIERQPRGVRRSVEA